MNRFSDRIGRLERHLARSVPSPEAIAWTRSALIEEGVDPDEVMQADGTMIVDGSEEQYIGCLRVLVRSADEMHGAKNPPET